MVTKGAQTGDRNMAWSDSPINSPTTDSYSFESFVERLAAFVGKTPKGADSTVFSLTGEWGSGKTSAVNLLKEKLQTSEFDEWSVVQFSPWATSDLNSMLVEFAQTIADARPGENRTSLQEKLASFVEKTSRVGALIPGTVGDTSKAVNELVRNLGGGKNWHHVVDELEKEIQEMDRQILVVVDDLDRLGSEELLAVLKLVRLLGRLSDVHYLLVYDQEVLNGILQTALPGSGEQWSGEYLEKFVQHGFRLPPLNEYQILMKINEWLEEHPNFAEPLTLDHRIAVLGSAMSRILRTPRRLHRFLHRLDFYDQFVDLDEVRADDLFFLTILEISTPTVYVTLWRLKMELITGNADYQVRHMGPAHGRQLTADSLTVNVPAVEGAAVQQILTQLFPSVSLNESSKKINRPMNEKSVADEDYFERYFMLDVPSGDISDNEVAEAVYCAAQGNGCELSDLLKGERSVAALTISKGMKLGGTLPFPVTTQERATLIATLVGIISNMDFDGPQVIDPRISVFDWVIMLMEELDSAEGELVIEAIDCAPDKVQETLGRFVANSSERGLLRSWFEVMAQSRIERVKRFLNGGEVAPIGFSFYSDFEFIKEAGEKDLLLKSVQLPPESSQVTALRIATLFIGYTLVTRPGAGRGGAIFKRSEMEEFAAHLDLDASTQKALSALRDFDRGVRVFRDGELENLSWYSLATELLE